MIGVTHTSVCWNKIKNELHFKGNEVWLQKEFLKKSDEEALTKIKCFNI